MPSSKMYVHAWHCHWHRSLTLLVLADGHGDRNGTGEITYDEYVYDVDGREQHPHLPYHDGRYGNLDSYQCSHEF